MKLIVQPGDGVDLLLKMIKRAKKSIEVVIFRLDLPQIEHALVEAAEGGVFVHALVAFTNRGGEKRPRGALIFLFHESGQVDRIEHVRGGVLMEGRTPGRLAAQFEDWVDADGEPPAEQEEEEG